MPIRRKFANRSMLFSVSAHTLATIAPTVRQAIRINSHTAVFEHATASQATVSSKARVCPARWRAHGTATTRRPMDRAVHPGRIGLQEHLNGAPIQAPPPAQTLTAVIPGCLATAAATAARNTTSRPHPRFHPRLTVGVVLLGFLELDVLDHGALVDTQQRTP
jgi:hypothetical protein